MATNSRYQIDMLNGPLLKKIIMLALPLAASSLLQQLFNSIDVAVVGRFASSQALAAVGSNTPVINLLINLFVGISMGANVIISNHIGQNDKKSIQDAVSTVGMVAVASGLFLMVLGICVARPILELMDTPHDVLDMAVTYLRIYFLGIPFFMIFNFGSAIFRSMGDTRRPLYILVVAGIVNTILNLVLVIVFHMSVAGVAIATSIANAVSAGLIVYMLLHEKEPYQLKRLHIEWRELKRMLQIGIPAGVQGMVFSLSNVVVQTAINGYGYGAIAGSAAAVNFEYYCYFLIPAFNGAYLSMVDFLKAVDGRIPNFAGIKYTYESLYEYNQCRLYADGKFDMLHGQDETILPCLAMGGAQGGIGGTTNYNGRCLTGILDAWKEGDIEKARELQNFAQEVINVICHFRGNIVGGKRIMKLIGLDLGKNRTPFNNMTDEEEARMKKELEDIDFFNKCNIF